MHILEAEVEDLLRKDTIEIVPFQERNLGFYSTFFLVSKKNGKMRPIINMRPLKQASSEDSLQNGNITKGLKSSEARRLGHIFRSERCLSARTIFFKSGLHF